MKISILILTSTLLLETIASEESPKVSFAFRDNESFYLKCQHAHPFMVAYPLDNSDPYREIKVAYSFTEQTRENYENHRKLEIHESSAIIAFKENIKWIECRDTERNLKTRVNLENYIKSVQKDWDLASLKKMQESYHDDLGWIPDVDLFSLKTYLIVLAFSFITLMPRFIKYQIIQRKLFLEMKQIQTLDGIDDGLYMNVIDLIKTDS